MGNYSKLIGSIVGGVVGLGVSIGLLPDAAQDPEIIGAVTVLFSALATYAFPANKPQ